MAEAKTARGRRIRTATIVDDDRQDELELEREGREDPGEAGAGVVDDELDELDEGSQAGAEARVEGAAVQAARKAWQTRKERAGYSSHCATMHHKRCKGDGCACGCHTAAEADATVAVEQPLPTGRRRRICSVCGQLGHDQRNCPNVGATDVATRAPRRPDKQAVGMLAPMVLGTVNFAVVTTWGVECGMSELESKLAVPSLQRILERMPAEAAGKASIIIDPIVLLTVAVMWGKRIIAIKDAQAQQKYATAPTEAARAAGLSGYVYDAAAAASDGQPPRNGANGAAGTSTAAPSATYVDRTGQPPQHAGPADANGTTGAAVPEQIRRSFDADV